ncbi:MAG: TIGR01212 family radical SAM protein [Bacteroidales bacterium]|jgi:radical SAM protein (TIGR01212 family)|nr:TIGR01212 family radical SAM protein [Bacteroidales bacterium]
MEAVTDRKQSAMYNDFSIFLQRRFGVKVQKISVNGGFTCPNRDGTKAWHGCTYCNNAAFSPAYCGSEASISAQIDAGIRFFGHKYPDMHYLAYFQSYSNTYAPLDTLRRRYEEALANGKVLGLVIATRPDCISEATLDLLAGLAERCFVMVEYGVETTNDSTLQRINRGHTFAESRQAICSTVVRNIPVCAHLILGLPGESRSDILNHADAISQLPVTALKLHQLQIHTDTAMAAAYTANPASFHLLTVDEYIALVADFLARLRKDIYIERFVSQAPPEMVVAPKWGLKNHEFTALLTRELRRRR